VAELPTIWLDRQLGDSRFDLARWLPNYLRWYFFAYGRRLTADQIVRRVAAHRAGAEPEAEPPAGAGATPDSPGGSDLRPRLDDSADQPTRTA
jgi:hypothetical protein